MSKAKTAISSAPTPLADAETQERQAAAGRSLNGQREQCRADSRQTRLSVLADQITLGFNAQSLVKYLAILAEHEERGDCLPVPISAGNLTRRPLSRLATLAAEWSARRESDVAMAGKLIALAISAPESAAMELGAMVAGKRTPAGEARHRKVGDRMRELLEAAMLDESKAVEQRPPNYQPTAAAPNLSEYLGPKTKADWRKEFGGMTATTFRNYCKDQLIVVHAVNAQLVYVRKDSVSMFYREPKPRNSAESHIK